MVKKAKWFFYGKTFNFSKQEGQNFKNLEILLSKFFQFSSGDNFWYIHLRKLKFSMYVLCWEYYRKIKNWTVIGQFQSLKFYHKIEKK